MSKYSYLNLNQKMIKIRKKLPSLMRKRYSEEVGYDFVKLDDINQFLTPALNRYGVDFDILREIPTHTTPSGAPVFLTRDENLWRYEADLEICWTNADHPEEKITSILHLIGTNDVADKAKGTALTYGLKYYLLNKFNIPQNAEDDPDMKAANPSQEQKSKPEKKMLSEKKGSSKTEAKEGQSMGFVPDKELEEGLKKTEKTKEPEQTKKTTLRDGNAVTPKKIEKEEQLSFQEIQEEALSSKKISEQVEMKKTPEVQMEDMTDVASEEEKISFQAEMEDDDIIVDDESDEDFRAATETDDIPFQEDEDDMPEAAYAEDAVEAQEDRIEAAKAVICNFGLYKGKTLGEMLKTPKGWESLKWLVTRYRGTNKEMVDAAKVLVEADAYHSNAA